MALLRFDIPLAEADGGGFEVRYWSITHSPVIDSNGEVQYVLQHPIDVTELEQLREATRDAADTPLNLLPSHSGIFKRAQDVFEANLNLLADVDRLQTLFEQAPSFMAVLRGPNHIFELANAAMVELMGPREYVGNSMRNVVPELVEQGFIDMLDHAYLTGEPTVAYGKPARFYRSPGIASDRFLNFIYQPISDAEGKVKGIFVEGNDVTEQYLAQRMRDEQILREARHKDEFLAMLAHELRNPLAPITSAAHLLGLKRLDSAGIVKASGIIERQAAHMSSLINDLLDVSRVTNGLVSLDFQSVAMEGIIEEALEQVRPLITSREHHLDIDLPTEDAFVTGDRKRLVQVLANLLTNAAKYTPEGGKLGLHMTLDRRHVELSVRDNGIGMTAEVQKNVFGLFMQAERTPDRAQGGLGIGLALVKSIIELHHGSVMVFSAGLGQGSIVTVQLPRAWEPDVHAKVMSLTMDRVGPPLKILVVDDNIDAAELLAMALGEHGQNVAVEHSSITALERVKTFTPEVCILDIGMPNIDGNQLARELRMLPSTQHALLVAITGYGTRHDRQTALASGFDHYFVKPVDITVLLQLLISARHE